MEKRSEARGRESVRGPVTRDVIGRGDIGPRISVVTTSPMRLPAEETSARETSARETSARGRSARSFGEGDVGERYVGG